MSLTILLITSALTGLSGFALGRYGWSKIKGEIEQIDDRFIALTEDAKAEVSEEYLKLKKVIASLKAKIG